MEHSLYQNSNVAPLERINILPCANQERLQSNNKGTMKVSTWLSMHLCLAQRLVELVNMIKGKQDLGLFFGGLHPDYWNSSYM